MADNKPTTPVSSGDDDFTKAVEASVKAYLDANLEDLVKAAMPPSPEQQAQAERESFAQRMAKDREAAERRAKREAREAKKAADLAAAEQAKRDAAAAKAFEDAVPFVGSTADITAKIVREIRIDDGAAYSADHNIAVHFSDLERGTDGGLILTKPIELSGRGREFGVQGVSLITDAGRLRIALNGSRKCGGGKAVQFPARSLVFRPARASAAAAN
jgi:multidrug efflux pump subunit AcrA (membrane-fusion protein)